MIVAFSVAPEGSTESLAPAVARAVRVVRESGLPNETSAMFTTVEGEWDEVMDVVRRATEAAGRDSSRISLTIKADIREGVSDALNGKVDAVERELGNK
ncbi:MTH1187 family thiamine-binding protein [Nocardiopsis kunsanensis]|nr:MTH1187 family thiamine-binding protein [Nocardiopsis kunsanensis]